MRIGDTPPIPPTSPNRGDDVLQELKDTLAAIDALMTQLQDDAKNNPSKVQDDWKKRWDLTGKLPDLLDQAVKQKLISPDTRASFDDMLGKSLDAFDFAFSAAAQNPPDLDTVNSKCEQAHNLLAQAMNIIWPW